MLRKRRADQLGLRPGHLYWVPLEGGPVRDVGAVPVEDARLLAFTVREIGARVKRTRVTDAAMTRARSLADRIYLVVRG